MATRGKATFQKRQKELQRKDRQQRKAERREERKRLRDDPESIPPQDDPLPFDSQGTDGDVVSRHIPMNE
jgi:hypothetical protein